MTHANGQKINLNIDHCTLFSIQLNYTTSTVWTICMQVCQFVQIKYSNMHNVRWRTRDAPLHRIEHESSDVNET